MTISSAPTLLQHNGKNIRFMAETGIVDKVSKRVETSIRASASGGGAHQFGNTVVSRPTTLNVSSSNTTVTELWIRSGEREVEHTLRTDLSVRETQKVSVVMVAAEGNRPGIIWALLITTQVPGNRSTLWNTSFITH